MVPFNYNFTHGILNKRCRMNSEHSDACGCKIKIVGRQVHIMPCSKEHAFIVTTDHPAKVIPHPQTYKQTTDGINVLFG